MVTIFYDYRNRMHTCNERFSKLAVDANFCDWFRSFTAIGDMWFVHKSEGIQGQSGRFSYALSQKKSVGKRSSFWKCSFQLEVRMGWKTCLALHRSLPLRTCHYVDPLCLMSSRQTWAGEYSLDGLVTHWRHRLVVALELKLMKLCAYGSHVCLSPWQSCWLKHLNKIFSLMLCWTGVP